MEQELWKDIEGYEGLYQISNFGNVKSLNYRRTGREKILQPLYHRSEILAVNRKFVRLSKNGIMKNKSISRMVAKAFVPGYEPGLVVHHKDNNPLNNVYTNLAWVTQTENLRPENIIYHTKKIQRNQEIFKLIDDGIRYKDIAAKFGLSEISIKKLAQKHKNDV